MERQIGFNRKNDDSDVKHIGKYPVGTLVRVSYGNEKIIGYLSEQNEMNIYLSPTLVSEFCHDVNGSAIGRKSRLEEKLPVTIPKHGIVIEPLTEEYFKELTNSGHDKKSDFQELTPKKVETKNIPNSRIKKAIQAYEASK